VCFGQIEDGEAFGDVVLGPGDELGLFVAPGFEEQAQPLLGVGAGLGVEDGVHTGDLLLVNALLLKASQATSIR
jgi:hypothetical protein